MRKFYNYKLVMGIYGKVACLMIMAASLSSPLFANVIITGVYDGPLSGGNPKGVELYVTQDVADLSAYAIGSANNGGGTDGEEFIFPAGAYSAGSFIYVATDSMGFADYFGFNPNFTSTAMGINGDDAVELFMGGSVIDVFGDINVDGNGEAWEYTDGWAYRKNGTGPDGSAFTLNNWTYAGIDAMDGCSDNATCTNPFPIGTYENVMSAAAEFDFFVNAFEVNEGDMATVNIALINPVDASVDVVVDASSTAAAGTDYTFASPQTVAFANGETEQTISIPTADNTTVDGDRTLVLNLENNTTGTLLGTVNQLVITIKDNDYEAVNIADVTDEDADGVATSLGALVSVTGVVYCTDFRGGNGYDFTLVDATGGISIFSFDDINDYVVTDGDELTITGEIGQFRGLTQLLPDNITIVSQGNMSGNYTVVTALDESTEAMPITLQEVSIVDATQLGDIGSSYNLDLTDGINTFTARIDSDANIDPNIFPLEVTFDLFGIGGQYGSSSAPFLDGYQIRPCNSEDIVYTSIDPVFGAAFAIFPNPVDEMLVIETDVAAYEVTISDVLGREIFRTNANATTSINTANLDKGLYIITLASGEKTWAERIVKR